jgi:hypothetical protein
MARSGSADFALTRDQIIKGAIRIVKGMGGKPITGAKAAQTEAAQAGEALNMMLKAWQGMGVGLWLNREISVPMAYRDGSYSLGTSGDHASESLFVTEVATAQTSGNNTLVLDSTAGVSDADAVGVELDDDTMQWTTINGTPASLTITLTAALTDDVAVNNEVMIYTTKSGRPLSITEARLVNDAGTETPLTILTRQEWMNIPSKDTNGTPSMVYYDPQLDSGILYVWPRPNLVNNYIQLTARMPIQDFDASTDSPDFPQEIYHAVKWNLAVEISPEYPGIDFQRFLLVEKLANRAFKRMADFDAEDGSIIFEADHD